jgi:hypothetical protein
VRRSRKSPQARLWLPAWPRWPAQAWPRRSAPRQRGSPSQRSQACSPPPSPQALWSVVILGVVCTALAFIVFFALIGEVGPNRATVITYVNPAVAVALGVKLLGEPFTLSIAAGFALIALGSFLGTRRARPGSDPQPLGATASPGSSSAADGR